MKHLQAGDLDRALAVSIAAVGRDPEYFKAHTYLGNVHFMSEEYSVAEAAFRRALELNLIDYQAQFFLADTYYRTGHHRQALDAITSMYVLNRNHAPVATLRRVILEANGLRRRTDRLTLPFSIEPQESEKSVRLLIGQEDLQEWLSLAVCLAVWHMEPTVRARFADRSEVERDRAMYRECLVNHAVVHVAR